MPLIRRNALERYWSVLDGLVRDAEGEVRRHIMSYASSVGPRDVARLRDYAISVARAAVERYGLSSCEIAAEFYDLMSEASDDYVPRGGGRFDDAELPSSLRDDALDKAVHYRAARLVSGDVDGFAKSVGEYVGCRVLHAADRTTLMNVARDAGAGAAGSVRFARVPRGFETCTFCLRMASKGFIYHSSESAGAMGRWHNGCKCSVIPGFPGLTDVEGYDPSALGEQADAFERIDADGSLDRDEKASAKLAWAMARGRERDYRPLTDDEIATMNSISAQIYDGMGGDSNERLAIFSYTTDGCGDINGFLAGGSGEGEMAGDIGDVATCIDSLMSDKTLGRDAVVYRAAGDHYSDWEIGSEHVFAHFSSTSVKRSISQRYFDERVSENRSAVMMEICVPKETRCFYIGDNTDAGKVPKPKSQVDADAWLQDESDEGELLLARGTRVRVIGRSGNLLRLEVTTS